MKNSFLYEQANYLVTNYFNQFNDIIIVLPNKRAKLFLIDYLKEISNQSFFVPKIISVESFIEELSGLKNIDSIELLFEFYILYKEIEKNHDTFEDFSGWASTFIQDINEIDQYLVDAKRLFNYLVAIDHINKWDVSIENTKLALQTVSFWKKLPKYYEAFRSRLKQNKIGYQGLLYSESADKIENFVKHNTKKYLFFGFNALNNAEQKLIKTLLENNQADVCFDIDEIFLNDTYHDAGLFLRKIKSSWKYFNTHEFKFITNEFKKPKNIHIIATPKAIGQAKITGKLIEKLVDETNENIHNTAVVLADENLLLPVLNSLPQSVSSLNISMGYPAINNPVQILIQKVIKFHLNAKKRKNNLYYKDILKILTNPFFEKICDVKSLIQFIKINNITFLSHSYFESIFIQNTNNEEEVYNNLFSQNIEPIDLIENLINILIQLKTSFDFVSQDEKVNLTFIYSIYNTLIKIKNYHLKYKQITTIEILFSIYKQIITQASVSFEGEPLTGLQIMGILETRNLDFENVIITSLNEGILPSGKSGNSFIPYDIKLEYGLPTYKERDAIFSYHFFRLLQRAKNIYLLYNNSTEGMDSGEKSRFINQIEYEYSSMHQVTQSNYNASLTSNPISKMNIEKDELLFDRLKEIATLSGFSPSSITTYIRNPIQFYFQRVLKIFPAEVVEEEIADNTFGTIIHGVLEKMYLPFLGNQILPSDIDNLFPLINSYTEEKFIEEYRKGSIDRGKNLISFEVAKRNIFNFLILEKEFLTQNAVTIVSLETVYHTILKKEEYTDLPFDIKINGTIDRIDLCNDTIRVIDYKTGKVEQKSLRINSIKGLTEQVANDKIIQLLCYGILVQNEFMQNQPIQVGIISFKNLSNGFMSLQFEKNDVYLSEDFLSDFKKELVHIILEILDTKVPFVEVI